MNTLPVLTSKQAFALGLRALFSVPTFSLFVSFLGYGAFVRENGVDLSIGMASTALIWALPSQVVFIQSMSSGAGLLAGFLAVTLSAIRFIPMLAAITPLMRGEHVSTRKMFILSHFVAITSWVESMRRFVHIERNKRVFFFIGFAIPLTIMNIGSTALGFVMASHVPQLIAAAMMFVMPVYFFLSLYGAARLNLDKLALIFGLAYGPVAYIYDPEMALLYAGVAGGVNAWLVAEYLRWKRRKDHG